MSSIIGHALIGSAIFVRKQSINSGRTVFTCLFFAVLSISPDLDYLIYWILDYELEPRITHSIFYCLVVGSCAVGVKKFILKNIFTSVPNKLFFIAVFSHLILDILVGVHPMPLFWPIDSHLIKLPFGVLPSAGQINLKNIYLWRNLLIEMGMLIPIAALIAPDYKNKLFSKSRIINFLLYFVFFISMFFGFSLNR